MKRFLTVLGIALIAVGGAVTSAMGEDVTFTDDYEFNVRGQLSAMAYWGNRGS